MPTSSQIILSVFAALLTFILGLISKQLDEIKKNRKLHETANTELTEKVEQLAQGLETVNKTIEEAQMRASRYRIIRFDDEETHEIRHSDDHWDQILEDVDIYKAYCQSHPNFQNHKGQGAMQRILTSDENGRGK